MKRLALALLSFFAPLGSVMAEEMKCAPTGQAVPFLIENADKVGGIVLPLQGDEAQAFLRVVNETPPVTSLKADMLLVIVMPDDRILMFLIHKARGETCGFVSLDQETASKALLASRAMRNRV